MEDPEVLAFARKVRVEPDEALQAQFPCVWPAEIEVRCAGQVLRRKVTSPRGDAANRLSPDQLRSKQRALLDQAVTPFDTDAALGSLMNTLDDPGPAVELMRRALERSE